jgi:hypothetical protein
MEQGPQCTLLPFHQLFKFRAGARQCQGWTNNAPHHQDSLIRFSPQTLRYRPLKFRAGGHQCQGRINNAHQHQDSLIRFSLRHSGTRSSSSGLGDIIVKGGQCQGRTDNAPQHQDSLIRPQVPTPSHSRLLQYRQRSHHYQKTLRHSGIRSLG